MSAPAHPLVSGGRFSMLTITRSGDSKRQRACLNEVSRQALRHRSEDNQRREREIPVPENLDLQTIASLVTAFDAYLSSLETAVRRCLGEADGAPCAELRLLPALDATPQTRAPRRRRPC